MLGHKIGWGARVRLGGWVIALAALASLATAEAAGDAFAAKAGCASQTAACLRSLPVSAIVDNEDFSGCKPDIDGKVLTQPIVAAFASGQFSRVPVIDGTSHDEWRLFVARQYWTAFAKRGVPSSRGRVAWPRFGGASQQMLSLVPPRPQIETSFAAGHHCAFWTRAG